MKIFLSSILFLFLSVSLFAQKIESIKVNVAKEEITVNDKLVLKSGVTTNEMIKLLGKPDRIEQSAGKDRYFIYDNQGIAFSVVPGTDKIESVTITYTYDNDKKVAKETYKGTLLVDKLTVIPQTTIDELNGKTDIDGLQCFGSMCMTDPKKKGIIVMAGLTEQKELLQVLFGFKK